MSKRIRKLRKNSCSLLSDKTNPHLSLFLKREFDFKPYHKQEEFLSSKENRIAFVGGRRTGKTELLAMSVLVNAIANFGKEILIVAPQKHMLEEIFNRIRKNTDSLDRLSIFLTRDVSKPYCQMEFSNGNRITGVASSSYGYRSINVDYIYVDEPAYVKDEFMFGCILPLVQVTQDAHLYLIGSPPVNTNNTFFHQFSSREDVKTIHCSMAEVLGAEKVEEIRDSYTPEYFETECLGNFV